MEKGKNGKTWSLLKFIAKTVSMAVLTVLVIIGLLLLFVFVSTKVANKKGATPPINLYTIISPSMTPNINVYDVVVAVKTDTSKLKVGDVISFYTNEVNVHGLTITHRIYQILNEDDGIYFKTKGDYNKYVDKWTVAERDIVGKVLFKLPQLGRVQFFLGSRGGWLIAILIPALAIIAYDIYKIIKLILIRQKIINYQKQEDIKENSKSNISSVTELYKEENSNALSVEESPHEDNSNEVLPMTETHSEEVVDNVPDSVETNVENTITLSTDSYRDDAISRVASTLEAYNEDIANEAPSTMEVKSEEPINSVPEVVESHTEDIPPVISSYEEPKEEIINIDDKEGE